MESIKKIEQGFVGREIEVNALNVGLESARTGSGVTILVSGEAGIGKSRLIEEFMTHAASEEVNILSGTASKDSEHPFLIFSNALKDHLFHEREHTTFTSVFAVNRAGMLIAQSSPGDSDMDPDIFAGMLSAVQNFVKDSFDAAGKSESGLGRLEYGSMKIIIKHGKHLFLTAVLEGVEHPDMSNVLNNAIIDIEREHGHVLEKWSGAMREVTGIQHSIDKLAGTHFLVRRVLEGMKLENERLKIANSIYERLWDLSQQAPLVLLLEDIHWADESSLFVLNYLSRNIGQERIMILGTIRSGENKNLEKTLQKMRAEGNMSEIALKKLGETDVSNLIGRILVPNDLPADFTEKLSRQCDGNPFFIKEILRHMLSEGAIGLLDGKYSLLNKDYSTPSSVEDVVQKRLENLEPDVMAMVEYASCIGQRFDIGVATSMKSMQNTSATLEKLVDTGLVVRENGSAHFSHGIVQEVTYESIGERWRQVYHRSIGEHYETAYPNPNDGMLYELARHFFRSTESQKAFDYCMKAGERAEVSFAPEQAITFFDQALATLPRLRSGIDERAKRIEILERLGDLAELMGDYGQAMSRFSSISDLDAEPKTRAKALWKQSHIHERKGNYKEGLVVLEQAKKLLGDKRTADMARILSYEGAIYESMRELDKSIATQTEALAIHKECGSPAIDISRIYSRIGTCLWTKNEFDSALEYFMMGLEIHESLKDLRGIAASLNNIAIVYIRKGDYTNAGEYLVKSMGIYRKIGDQSGLASSSGNLGNVYMAKGEYARARETYQICIDVFTKIGARQALAMTLMNVGGIHHHIGEFDKAMELYNKSLDIREAISDIRGMGATILNIGMMQFDMGNFELSLDSLTRAKKILEELGDKNAVTHTLCGISRILIRNGRGLEARELIDRALAYSREMGMEDSEKTALVIHGMLATESGKWDDAEKAFKDCIEYGRKGGYKRIQADALWEYGKMQSQKGQKVEAIRLIEESMELFREMNQPHMIKEVECDLKKIRAAK